MAFLGFYTRNETVRCYAVFVDLSGQPVEPANVVVSIFQSGVEIVASAAMTQQSAGSNLFYYDYTIPASPTEGTLEAVYSGEIDGEVRQGSDHFAINLIKSHVLENRLGNQRITFYEATSIDPVRNTAIGVLDRQVIETRDNAASDWSSPTSSKTLWFWYETVGDINPVKVGEDG